MTTKFLYCKYDKLRKVIHDGAAIRFTDIHYYANLENERIRDNESKRDYNFTSNFISTNKMILQVDDFIINPEDIANIQLSFKTRRAHVLCLSNDGHSQELFNHFNADTCIEIDVDFLIRMLKDGFRNINENIEIIGKDVYYYTNNSKIKKDPTELVFVKYEQFHVENEYRIAIFYPFDDETMFNAQTGGGTKLFDGIGTYLFSWNDVPGNDNVRLTDFLKESFSIDWVNEAEIEKIDDGKSIKVSTEQNILLLTRVNEKTTLNLEIDDGRTDELIAKTENNKLNIYTKQKYIEIKINDGNVLSGAIVEARRKDESIIN